MAKGSTKARGYGYQHKLRRKADEAAVEAGQAVCWRCGRPIVPMKILRRDGRMVSNWHLGHDDYDRSVYRGPEHERCNLRGAALKANRSPSRRARRRPRLPGGVFGPLSS